MRFGPSWNLSSKTTSDRNKDTWVAHCQKSVLTRLLTEHRSIKPDDFRWPVRGEQRFFLSLVRRPMPPLQVAVLAILMSGRER